MKLNNLIFLAAAILILQGCADPEERYEERYDVGYDDGYASGYNTTCKIRATIIEGDWEDENYTKGYNDGYVDGAEGCKKGISE